MDFNKNNLSQIEIAAYRLRALYESYGYLQYKMSKFEEYDLYVRNKSFLVSDNIITFTDTDGKLMALKPDVTLSIVKNSRESDGGVRKVFYNENVYRVPRGGFSFKEIMQAGLECIGDIDKYSMLEVLRLAAASLELISTDYVLDISHMGIISSVVDRMGLSSAGRQQVLTCVGEKNLHGIDAACLAEGKEISCADTLKKLLSMPSSCDEMLDILSGCDCAEEARELVEIFRILSADNSKVRIDFSVTGDMGYYSGIVFKGFVKGIPTSILSGGRYDNLMKRMGKKAGAVGFAVYLDLVVELDDAVDEYDTDVLVVYDNTTDLAELNKTVSGIVENGEKVLVLKSIPEKLKYKKLVKLLGE